MQVLAIETSERTGSLATLVASDDSVSVVRSMTLPSDQRSAQSLLPAIQTLLAECSWTPNQLGLICVTTGPGSFTGLRIGVTTAKTLAYATGAPLVEVHTLSAIAAGVTAAYQKLWTILDAQRNELFVACFQQGWQEQACQAPDTRILGVDEWLQELQPGDLVSGPPLKKLADHLPDEINTVDESLWEPNAAIVGALGVRAYRNGQAVNAIQLVPRYFRKSAAEEKADA